MPYVGLLEKFDAVGSRHKLSYLIQAKTDLPVLSDVTLSDTLVVNESPCLSGLGRKKVGLSIKFSLYGLREKFAFWKMDRELRCMLRVSSV